MQHKITAICAAMVFGVSGAALGQIQETPQNTQQPANGKFLVEAIVSGLSAGVSGGLASGFSMGMTGFLGTMWNKITCYFFENPQCQQQNGQNGNQNNNFGSVNPQPIQQIQPIQQPENQNSNVTVNPIVTNPSGTDLTPAIAYSIQKLDPNTYQTVQVFENVNANTPQLKTGDVFAIIYSSNMPGQVRLENIDSQNEVSPIGTYNVIGRQNRRLPINKGFKLSGTPGKEQINIYYTPCRPPEALNDMGVVEFQTLPTCSNNVATVLSKAGKAGGVRPKKVENLDSPDPTISVGVSPNYTKDDLKNGTPVKNEITIIHTNGI